MHTVGTVAEAMCLNCHAVAQGVADHNACNGHEVSRQHETNAA